MPRPGKIKVHIKNNRHAADTFPNTARGEEVFTITRERYAAAAEAFPDVAARLEAFIDWDTDHFAESMAAAETLVCWNLPTAELARVAPRLKWIHIIGAGVEHLTPMDWLPYGGAIQQWTYRLRGTIIPRLVALPQQRGAEVRVGGSYMNPLDSIPGTIVAGIVLSFLLAYLAKVLIGG